MTHHPDQIADLARLRHQEHARLAARQPIADVMRTERRRPLALVRRLLVQRRAEPAHVREFRVA